MSYRQFPENGRFRVAFSLAGEQRPLVRSVAEAVEQKLGPPSVFLDEWFQYYIDGADADLKLQDIYLQKCDLAVICISAKYGDKPWTQAEYAAVRARYMRAQGDKEELGVLPIRVGDGEVEGILFNTIATDIRKISLAEAADLIVMRLNLIVPGVGAAASAPLNWPALPPLHWPMADHRAARDAFQVLVTAAPKYRYLPLRGPSEVGKTHVTQQMLGNALQTDLACGRFDFKGRTDTESEVSSFVQFLGVPAPPADLPLAKRLEQIVDALKQRSRPALLIFDTYNDAPQAARDWVEKQLLPALIRASWLRVVIAGQQVPDPAVAFWGSVSSPVVELQPPPAEDWFEFAQELGLKDVDRDFVYKAYQRCRGRSSIMAGLFGVQ